MSIMNDRWIISQCIPPTHMVVVATPGIPDVCAWAGLTHEKSVLDRYVKSQHAVVVTEEILEKDLEWRPMITPFIRDCVRKVDDNKVISFGVSSFGYDVRLGNEFKIFTNANGGIIDPKRLDESAVLIDGIVRFDEWGDRYVILPPNSYLLGRTMEHFIIPRDVMVVCLGKCLAGDTLITIPETGEIKRMDSTAGITTVQGIDDTATNISIYPTDGLICNGVLPMVTVNTGRGLSITATDTHPLRTWSGWRPIAELSVGSRIAIAREERIEGPNFISGAEARLLGYMIADGQCDTPGSSPVFTKADPVVMSAFIQDATNYGFIVSPRDATSVRLVNRIGSGGIAQINQATLWLRGHGVAKRAAEKTVPMAIQTSTLAGLAEFLSALFTCDGHFSGSPNVDRTCLEYYTTSEVLAKQVQILLRRFGVFMSYHSTEKQLNGSSFPLFILRTTTLDTIHKFHVCIGFIKDSVKYNALKEWAADGRRAKRSNWDTLPSEAWGTLDLIFARLGITYRSVGIHPYRNQSVPLTLLRRVAAKINDAELLALANPDVIWDVITDITPAAAQLAYDFTVPEVHNFIANGIVVHNSTYARSGAIVNVTPIEAEFEGNVVIEISNSTTLPMKVYVGEGVSQFLFFKGNAPCMVSYKDRGGKYFGQSGITLPKV